MQGGSPLRLAVGLVPRLATTASTDVCIVVDVLRATTTLTCLIEQGVTAVAIAADTEAARAAKRRDPTLLLLGEEDALRPADFDLGNSPLDIRSELVAGRRAVCRTSNGTAALRAVADAPVVLLGCLRNAEAVARAAVAAADALDTGITVVCSGLGGGRNFALDDALAAGYLTWRLADVWRRRRGEPPALDDTARGARALYEGEVAPRGPASDEGSEGWSRALRATASGRHLERIGLGADIDYASRADASTTVAEARVIDEVLLVVPHGTPAANPAHAAAGATTILDGEEAAGA
jgi:2-phosphosulfolactate phosphatase